jgi:hypothetical protein
MKVAIKNKSEWKYIDSKDVEVDGVTLADVYQRLNDAEAVVAQLISELRNKFIVEHDQPYIVRLGDSLHEVDKLEVFEAKDLEFPLKYYKVVNGKLVVDKKKVGAV